MCRGGPGVCIVMDTLYAGAGNDDSDIFPKLIDCESVMEASLR